MFTVVALTLLSSEIYGNDSFFSKWVLGGEGEYFFWGGVTKGFSVVFLFCEVKQKPKYSE